MGHSISCSSGKVSLRHDQREYAKGKYPKNIDESRTHLNECFVHCDTTIEQAFNDFFKDSIDNYNTKQSRSDRKKGNYYEEIQNSKNKETAVYEYVFQIGNADNVRFTDKEKDIVAVLRKYAQDFQKNNPQFQVLSSNLHLDEATPHLHIAFIPFADGYQKGLEKRCSTSQALEKMGYHGKDRSMKGWKREQENTIEQLMQERGLERVRFGSTRGRVDVELYKEIKDKALEEVKEEVKTYRRTEKRKVTKKINELYQEQYSLEGYNETLTNRQNAIAGASKIAHNELKEVQGDISTLNRKKVKLEGVVALLEEDITDKEKEISILEDDISNLKENKGLIERGIESLQKSYDELKKKYIDLMKSPPKIKTIEKVVEKIVEIPKEVEKIVEKVKWVTKEIPKEVIVEKEVEKEVEKIKWIEKEKIKEIPKIVEVKKEVEVEKIVEVNADYKELSQTVLSAFVKMANNMDLNERKRIYDKMYNTDDEFHDTYYLTFGSGVGKIPDLDYAAAYVGNEILNQSRRRG